MHYDTIIVGGGAGGLELAARLGRKLGRKRGVERVLLVDRSVFHIWKPTLHEVAAGTLDVHQEGLGYTILARRNHFSFTLGEMTGLDAAGRRITLGALRDSDGTVLAPERTITFNHLVLAVGSGSNFFGTPGAETAHALESTADAERFHGRLLAAFTRASFSESRSLGVAIVGGGATGVELSAELIEAHRALDEGLAPEQRFRLDITLVEAGPRILAALPEKIADQAQLALERKGVRVLTDTKVERVEDGALVTSAGRTPAELIVWAAGVKAAAANAGFGLAVNRLNQFVVNDRLETAAPGVWAMGDCAAAPWKDGRDVPARASAAHQQSDYLSQVIGYRMAERRLEKPFVYRDFGSLVSLGENRGLGALMGGLGGPNFFVEGLMAKAVYMSLHLDHHRAILGAARTGVLALARLLQRRVAGRLKLH